MPKASFLFLSAMILVLSAGLAIAQEVPFGQVPSAVYSPEPFGLWLQTFRNEARGQGISEGLLDEAFQGFTPDERVVALDRKQPEAKGQKSFTSYATSVVSAQRVAEGRRLYAQHRPQLDAIGAKYGVLPQYIVSLWGIETHYGKITGNYNIPHALATLAYEGRRAAFFRKELMDALRIIQAGHILLAQMKGSWAGAMGQSQFMPSSFLSFAVDENGDGRKDIWNTQADIFGSIANYLHGSGWDASHGWGVPVTLPERFNASYADGKTMRPAAAWRQLGLRAANGGSLSAGLPPAALKTPGKPGEGAYLIFDNYKVIMKWNRSDYFATCVGLLADRIAAP